jgi:hypothetical protein
VTAAALVSIAVTPVTQSVPDGLTQQFAAKPAARTILAAPTWCVRTVTHILAATFARAASQASPAARAPTAPAAATKA